MSFFLFSSAHEYILRTLPAFDFIEIVKVHRPEERGILIEFNIEKDTQNIKTIIAPRVEFFDEYHLKSVYAFKIERPENKLTLSDAYLKSLKSNPQILDYIAYLRMPHQHRPQIEDYFKLNKLLHALKF